jgi:transcriptional regulator with XRE-family HTH domain
MNINLKDFDKSMLIRFIEIQKELLDSRSSTMKQFDKLCEDLICFSKNKKCSILKQEIKGVFGGQTKLADRLGVSQVVVSQWVRGESDIPEYRKKEIYELSDGKIRI